MDITFISNIYNTIIENLEIINNNRNILRYSKNIISLKLITTLYINNILDNIYKIHIKFNSILNPVVYNNNFFGGYNNLNETSLYHDPKKLNSSIKRTNDSIINNMIFKLISKIEKFKTNIELYIEIFNFMSYYLIPDLIKKGLLDTTNNIIYSDSKSINEFVRNYNENHLKSPSKTIDNIIKILVYENLLSMSKLLNNTIYNESINNNLKSIKKYLSTNVKINRTINKAG
jgi:hypothetical protein